MTVRTAKRLNAPLWTSLIAATVVTVWAFPSLAKPGGKHSPAQREQMLQKISALKLNGLSEALELDEAAQTELEARLKPFDAERTRLRVENYRAMKTLRNARHQTGSKDEVAAALLLAENRVKLAQIDESELQEVLKGVSGEKAGKAALFLIRFPRKVEKMAGKMHKHRRQKPAKD